MTKKVLISLEDINQIENKAWECAQKFIAGSPPLAGIASFEIKLKEWFDSQPEAPQWVSVEGEFPPVGEHIIVWRIDHGPEYMQYISRMGNDPFDYDDDQSNLFEEISHWMPIPPLPGVGE